MYFKTALAMICFFGSRFAPAKETCAHSREALMKYEERVLSAADQFQKHHRGLMAVTEPLACILEIQEHGGDSLRYFANSFLRPIFGGPQINGVPHDRRYKIIADELTKISARSDADLDRSVMAAHSRGSWHFYKLFCERGDLEFCPAMLPNEHRVAEESPLLAASNMLLLRHAYYTLQGKQRDEIAARIKFIYKTLPLDKGLKRKVIDQIYSELFARAMPLSYMS